jgi:ESCRT-I complex subunit VPS28
VSGGTRLIVYELTRDDLLFQSFITFMDALKLNLRAKDQLHPFLTELMSGYSKFKGSVEWEGRAKILHW